MVVLKFGGTSVGTAASILQIVNIIKARPDHDNMVIVVSAMSGVTNLLETAARQAALQDEQFKVTLSHISRIHDECVASLGLPSRLSSRVISEIRDPLQRLGEICKGVFLVGDLTDKTKAHILGFGEILSSRLLLTALEAGEMSPNWLDSRTLIATDANYLSAKVDYEKSVEAILGAISNNGLFVIPGFVSRSITGENTILGRGGSDFTAAIIAAALQSDVLEIWTDVNGMLSADPRLVPEALTIPVLSYEEAMELSYFGAKVIYPPTIQPVMSRQIPVLIKNTFDPDSAGTLIQALPPKDKYYVKGLTSIREIALITISGSGMVGTPGMAQRIFQALSGLSVNALFVSQSSSEHSLCFAIARAESNRVLPSLRELYKHELVSGEIDPIQIDDQMSLIAVVGDQMKGRPGVAGRIFNLLGENGISVVAIAQGSSERNISLIVPQYQVERSLNVLHEGFFLSRFKTVHLFILGYGFVGRSLLEQLRLTQEKLLQDGSVDLRLCSIANSRKMYFDPVGINTADVVTILEKGEPLDLNIFAEKVNSLNLRNSIVIDVTASSEVSNYYPFFLKHNIHVVTANKIAASAPYDFYQLIRRTASEHHVKFLNETNVGAGLPVIKTIRELVNTGDKIRKIEAVLSGSLNFIFEKVGKQVTTFSGAVTEAREAGYTEPNPALDLSGTDVMRKILILAREAGFTVNMEDIRNEAFLPSGILTLNDWDELKRELTLLDSDFATLAANTASQGKKLRYIATCKDGVLKTGLVAVEAEHPAYQLEGTDNIILIWTDRYASRPMVIAGPGAGPEVTASGVLGDIISICSI